MAIKTIDDSNLVAIADAIRAKNGSTDTYKPSEMAAAIAAIATSGGGGDWQTAAISTTYDSATDISTVPISNYITDIENGTYVLFVPVKKNNNSNPFSYYMITPAVVKLWNTFYNNTNGKFSPATGGYIANKSMMVSSFGQNGIFNANTRMAEAVNRIANIWYGTQSFNENGDFIITGTSDTFKGKRLGYWAFLAYKGGT